MNISLLVINIDGLKVISTILFTKKKKEYVEREDFNCVWKMKQKS